MFDKMISWGELIVLVLFVLGSVLLAYLILAVANLLRVLKNVNQIIEKSKDDIAKTIEKLPEITDNAAKITKAVNDNIEGIDKIITDVGKVTETVKKGAETIQKDILLKAKSIIDIIDAVKKFFEKRKKSKTSKKSGTVYKYKYKEGQDKPEEIEVIKTDDEPDGMVPDDYEKVEDVPSAEDEILVAGEDETTEEEEPADEGQE